MKLVYSVKSDVGRVRDGNEDSYILSSPLFVVADGVGGHVAGEVASQTAVEVIRESLEDDPVAHLDDLAHTVKKANAAIWDRAQEDSSLSGMGTTCTLMVVDGSTAHIAHVGDSRAYLLRDDELSQITEDHTLVARMVKEGRLAPDEAQHHPQRSIITRALGLSEEVEVDLLTIELRDGDRVLLCSDGLSDMIDNEQIHDTLAHGDDAAAAAERLVDLANESGGEDNITVVVVDARGNGGGSAPPPPPGGPHDTSEAPRHATRQGAPEAPAAPPPRRAAHPEARGSRRGRKLVAALIVLLLILGGGYAAARWALQNSWYIGTGNNGRVTIYQGIPDEIAGLSFSDPIRETTISTNELPDFLANNVHDGIKATSLTDAQTRVANLRERARDFARPTRKKTTADKSPSPSPGSGSNKSPGGKN